MAGRVNLYVDAGSTLDKPFVWYNPLLDDDGNVVKDAATGEPKPDTASPIDLTGLKARMQVRRNYDTTTVDLSLTTENGGITLGGAAGTVRIFVTAEQTSALRSGVYDLEVYAPASGETPERVTRLLQGKFRVSREVTR